MKGRAEKAAESPVESPRALFVRLLSEAAGGMSRKALAEKLRVSPTRVSEFLRPLQARDANFVGEDHADDDKLKKAVGGFAASVYRACVWLQGEAPVDEEFIHQVVREFLAEDWRDSKYAPELRATVDAAIETARKGELSEPKAAIRIHVVPWEPFANEDDARASLRSNEALRRSKKGLREDSENIDDYGFLGAYARALVERIDPIDAEIKPSLTSFSDALNVAASNRREGRNASLGLYNILYRRFRGFQFVTFPAIRVPLTGLVVSRRVLKEVGGFRQTFGRRPQRKIFVVEDEVGELFARSNVEDKARVISIAAPSSASIAEAVVAKIEETLDSEGGEVAFLSDAILAFETFAAITKMGQAKVSVVQPDEEDVDALSHSIGFMLRDEDSDFAQLLHDAQRQLLSVPWQSERLFEKFLFGAKAWARKHSIPDPKAWSAAAKRRAPVFRFGKRQLADYLSSSSPRLADALENEVYNWTVAFLQRHRNGDSRLLGELLWERENAFKT